MDDILLLKEQEVLIKKLNTKKSYRDEKTKKMREKVIKRSCNKFMYVRFTKYLLIYQVRKIYDSDQVV